MNVDMEPHVAEVDFLIENPVAREYFASEVEPILEPYKGMEFESEDAARAFYNAYAARIGFKVRVSSFIRSKRDKTIISRHLVCSREGFRSNKALTNENKPKRPRIVTRVGCRASIMVKKQRSGKWVIAKCEKRHNHVLGTQGKVLMLNYNPYALEDEDVIENPIGESHTGGVLENSLGLVVPQEGDPDLEPHVGMEFESENAAQVFYKAYAKRVGFRARISSYYRSKRDNTIISRLIVCSKEGFRVKKDENTEEMFQKPRAITRVGCKAMIMVKKRDSGEWIVSKLVKSHNHPLTADIVSDNEHSEAEAELVEAEKALVTSKGDSIMDPHEGMEFESEDAAKMFYFAYSRYVGFNMRVSTYYRSKRDKSIISRLFVCSKEGFYVKKDVGSEVKVKRPREATRVGCKAMLMVKKNGSGKWVVSKFEKEHNHPLGSHRKVRWLRKWKHLTTNVKSLKNQVEPRNSSQESPTSRYNNLCREAIKYAEVGATSADVYNVAIQALSEAVKKVAAMKKAAVAGAKVSMVGGGDNMEGSVSIGGQNDIIISKNLHSTTRSRPLNSQSKPVSQKRTSRLKMCNVCKQPGDHTTCSCSNQVENSQLVNSVPVDPFSTIFGGPVN
uniref:Protein FAR1-RELATED SEQUENCE 7 n=1 Tax=Anthurium amnicola TaxID=1678845 RepID=A0A1D1YME8_9ARAE